MYDVDRPSGLPLNRLVDDAPSHAVDQDHADKTSLLVEVGALRHHGKQVGVQILQDQRGRVRKCQKIEVYVERMNIWVVLRRLPLPPPL